ncbi:MAG: hypothetical protein OXG13_12005 [Gemmatimonadaceae bacterium]|nr:hypothetical protein [Gemmatimonadaceae bacterium]
MSPAGRAAAVLAILSFAGSRSDAQGVYYPNTQAIDTVTDPRSLAMGESAVADAGNAAAAFSSNPANLAFLSGTDLFCNYRSDWVDDDWEIEDLYSWSLGLASASPLGRIAIAFHRKENGTGADFRDYSQTISLAYAGSRGRIAVGGTLRLFNQFFFLDLPDYESESSYLPSFDLGALYHVRGSENGPNGGISIGMALQNYSSDHVSTTTFDGRTSEARISLPLYLRAGMRYAIDRPFTEISGPFRFVATAEYRRFLNPPAGGGFEGDDIVRDADFGGIGLELTLYRWLSLRTGWINEYQDRHRLLNRLGLGINLSPDGGRLPGQVGLDYALIRVPEGLVVESTTFVHSFGLRMSW